jgi:hypothetical protein
MLALAAGTRQRLPEASKILDQLEDPGLAGRGLHHAYYLNTDSLLLEVISSLEYETYECRSHVLRSNFIGV